MMAKQVRDTGKVQQQDWTQGKTQILGRAFEQTNDKHDTNIPPAPLNEAESNLAHPCEEVAT